MCIYLQKRKRDVLLEIRKVADRSKRLMKMNVEHNSSMIDVMEKAGRLIQELLPEPGEEKFKDIPRMRVAEMTPAERKVDEEADEQLLRLEREVRKSTVSERVRKERDLNKAREEWNYKKGGKKHFSAENRAKGIEFARTVRGPAKADEITLQAERADHGRHLGLHTPGVRGDTPNQDWNKWAPVHGSG